MKNCGICFKVSLFLTFITVTFFISEPRPLCAADNITWVGSCDNNWYTGACWDTGNYPVSVDTVTIALDGANVTVSASSPSITFSSMSLGNVAGNTVFLTVSTTILNGGDLVIHSNAVLTFGSAMRSILNDLIIKAGGNLTYKANSFSQDYSLNLIVNNDLTIDSGGAIDISYLKAVLASEPDNPEISKYLKEAKKRLERRRRQKELGREVRVGALFKQANQAFEADDYIKANWLADEILLLGPHLPASNLKRNIRTAIQESQKAHEKPMALPPLPLPTDQDIRRAEELYYEAVRNYAEGKIEEAIMKLKRGLNFNPYSDTIKNTLERIRKEMKQQPES